MVLGQRKGELNEETKEKGVCLIFNPDKGDIHFLPDLIRNRKCGPGNTMVVGQKLIVFGGIKKDGEYLDLANPGHPWTGFLSYKGISQTVLTDCASCIY